MTETLRLASGLRRAIALVLEVGVSVLPVLVALRAGWLDARAFSLPSGWFWTEWWLIVWLDAPHTITAPILWVVIICWVWHLLWWVLASRTPIEVLMRCRAVTPEGEQPSPLRRLVRSVGIGLNLATLGLGWGLIWITPSRRALHDFGSGVVVVRDEKG